MNQYKFVWKGRDPQGNVRSEEVMAENAQAAREELTRRGWTELEMVFDEIASSAGAGVEFPEWLAGASSCTSFPGKDEDRQTPLTPSLSPSGGERVSAGRVRGEVSAQQSSPRPSKRKTGVAPVSILGGAFALILIHGMVQT
jgi:hypothetical protein